MKIGNHTNYGESEMSEIKDIRIEVRVKNNLLLSAMEQRGIATVAELCRQMGVPSRQSHVGDLINMKSPARKASGDWYPLVIKLSDFFQCMPEDLFSDPQQYNKLEKNRAYAELGFGELQQAIEQESPATPEKRLEAKQLHTAIVRTLQKLTPREERVLRMRFGIDCEEMTLEEVGQVFNLSQERIRGIEAKALMKLRRPAYVRTLLAAI